MMELDGPGVLCLSSSLSIEQILCNSNISDRVFVAGEQWFLVYQPKESSTLSLFALIALEQSEF